MSEAHLSVTRRGDRAVIAPLPSRTLHISEIHRQAAAVPKMGAAALRRDVDDIFDQTL